MLLVICPHQATYITTTRQYLGMHKCKSVASSDITSVGQRVGIEKDDIASVRVYHDYLGMKLDI